MKIEIFSKNTKFSKSRHFKKIPTNFYIFKKFFLWITVSLKTEIENLSRAVPLEVLESAFQRC